MAEDLEGGAHPLNGSDFPVGVAGLMQRPQLLSEHCRSWPGLTVEEYSRSAGEGIYQLDRHRIFLSLSEQSRSIVDIDGKRVWDGTLPVHRLTFAPAGTKVWATGPAADAVVIYHEPAIYRGILSATLSQTNDAFEAVVGSDDPTVVGLALALRREAREHGLADILLAESLSTALAVAILRLALPSVLHAQAAEGLTRDCLRRIGEYVRDNLGNSRLSLRDLAQIAGLSVFHFSRSFKRATGHTPHAYVIHQRIEHAKRLIRFGDLTLPEIARTCGFGSQSHFTARFRSMTGTTPTGFRRAAR